jgi:hypothetical protein
MMRRRAVTSVAIGVCFALAACGNDPVGPTKVTPPPGRVLQSHVLSLIELTIDDLSGPNMLATIRILADLSGNTLTLSPNSVTILATPTQKFFGVRLLVTHPLLGQDSIILVPVADATTFEGTPFRTFLRRDRTTGRADRARQILASPSMGIDGAGQLVADSGSFRSLTDSDIIGIARPPGVISAFPHAFVVREFHDAPGEFDVRITYALPRPDAIEDPVTLSILMLVLRVESATPQIVTRGGT